MAGAGLDFEPIAAPACAYHSGALSIIRISGPRLASLLEGVFSTPPWQREPRRAIYTQICDGAQVLDDVIAVYYQGPHSYTGEDLIEISCHGGTYITSKVMELLENRSIRSADPGEFTKRAFLNGKMDLTRAEGINELIRAQSDHQFKAARQLASGMLATHLEELERLLVEAMGLVEARIDFPEEQEVEVAGIDPAAEALKLLQDKLEQLASSYKEGSIKASGFKVAIVGIPNAGKSSLLNNLLGDERAIVTSTAGTTRDFLREGCLIAGRLMILYDTAGIRATDDEIEQLGAERSRELLKEADLSLVLIPADQDLEASRNVLNLVEGLPHLKVLSKADIGVPDWAEGMHRLSTISRDGSQELKQALVAAYNQAAPDTDEGPFLTTRRHYSSITQALNYVSKALQMILEGEPEECVAFELSQTRRALVSVLGVIDNDQVFDYIFSNFCIGK